MLAPGSDRGSVRRSLQSQASGALHTATNGTTSLLGYQGEYTEPGTGRVNMHARWYTPATANFTSRDDWTLNPDPSVQGNRYTYANAAPLDGTDPTGHYLCGKRPSRLNWITCPVKYAAKGAKRGRVGWGAAIGAGIGASYGLGAAAGIWWGANWFPQSPAGAGGGYPGPYNIWDNGCWGCNVNGGTVTGGGVMHTGGRPRPQAPPRPTPAQIQKKQAEWARDHPKPRPPMVNTVTQKHVDAIRGRIEGKVKTKTAVNDPTPILAAPDRDKPSRNARPQTQTSSPRPSAPPGNGRDDDGCVPIKDYGHFYANGQHSTAYARLCSKADLKGGSKASNSIDPPGWPGDLPDGRSGNPRLGSSYKYARCHLIGRQLGGSGKDRDNLVTCLQKPVNSPVMSGREKEVADAVRAGQIVDYWVQPIYNRGSVMPNKIHIVARGKYRNGAPGISLDRCIINRSRSAATDKWKVDYPGGFC